MSAVSSSNPKAPHNEAACGRGLETEYSFKFEIGDIKMFEWHGYGGSMMWILWILIIVAPIWFVALATRRVRVRSVYMKSAREILKERYANGELDNEKFNQKKKGLGN